MCSLWTAGLLASPCLREYTHPVTSQLGLRRVRCSSVSAVLQRRFEVVANSFSQQLIDRSQSVSVPSAASPQNATPHEALPLDGPHSPQQENSCIADITGDECQASALSDAE